MRNSEKQKRRPNLTGALSWPVTCGGVGAGPLPPVSRVFGRPPVPLQRCALSQPGEGRLTLLEEPRDPARFSVEAVILVCAVLHSRIHQVISDDKGDADVLSIIRAGYDLLKGDEHSWGQGVNVAQVTQCPYPGRLSENWIALLGAAQPLGDGLRLEIGED